MKLIDGGPDSTEKIIQLSGTPEQAERAQSLLQGFILSSKNPSSLPLSLADIEHDVINISQLTQHNCGFVQPKKMVRRRGEFICCPAKLGETTIFINDDRYLSDCYVV